MPAAPLTPQIVTMIISHVQSSGLKLGDHLSAQHYADLFKVSRSPVNEALKQLERLRIVRREPNRGYFLAKDAIEIEARPKSSAAVEAGDEVHFQIAEHRLTGTLPERVSENEIMRRYGLSRGDALKVLNRMAREGWAERLPGKGWQFLAMLTSGQAYEMAYLFRIAIEPAALLQASFRPDHMSLQRVREQQQALLDGHYLTLSRSELFRINAGLHETIVEWSGNPYFVEAIKRVNASRRLAEHRKTVDRSRLVGQSLEHIRILDLIEAGEMEKAAEFLRFHLEYALKLKSDGNLSDL